MSKKNRRAGINRREFMKVSGTAIAGAGALAQVGETQAKENNLFDTVCPKMVQTAAEILEEMC